MTEWEKRLSAVNLIVGDLERVKAFYGLVFGFTPLHEEDGLAIFRFGETFFAVRHDPARATETSDEYLRLARKGAGQFSIRVEDVDAVHAELAAHSVTFIDGPADRPWGMRTLTFADPAGYTWGIAQDLD
jgi:catechol 2,3-dioxygenase-like lactoylglutathione lyase family enzyme